eukprot:jgi/Chlat1/5048/Chrsp33S04998
MALGLAAWGRATLNRAQRGLYAGRKVLYGNKVSEDGGNRSRRRWKPNRQNKHLFSELLDRMVPCQVTTHALRCIDKAGGLDSYVLNTKVADLDSAFGLELRQRLQSRLRHQQQQGSREDSAPSTAVEHTQSQTQTQQEQPASPL